MARLFDDGASQYLSYAGAFITATPLSISVWFYPDDDGSFHPLVGISNSGNINDYFALLIGSGQNVWALIDDGAGQAGSTTATTLTNNSWNHCMAVFATTTSRSSWLNGLNKDTDATDRTPAGIDQTEIATILRSNPIGYASGRIAEIGLWNADLSDAEVAILATGISPLAVRPQSLVAYWPLMGNLSPEPDWLENKYSMTLVNGPTKADHPPVMYPVSPQIIHVPTGVTTMGRMYTVSNSVAGVTTAIDLLRISAPSDAVVIVHKILVTQETEFGDAASEQMDIQFHRGSTDGSGGASPTARPLEVGDTAFGGTVATGNGTQSTEGVILHAEAANVMAGFVWAPTPEERVVLSPSGRLIVELPTAPDDSIDFRVTAYFEEIGG